MAPSGSRRAHSASRGSEAFRTDEPGADPHVEMHPVLGDLSLWDALEEQPGSLPCGIKACEPCVPVLGRLGTVELVPRGEALRWRRRDVPQHLAPEPSNALG